MFEDLSAPFPDDEDSEDGFVVENDARQVVPFDSVIPVTRSKKSHASFEQWYTSIMKSGFFERAVHYTCIERQGLPAMMFHYSNHGFDHHCSKCQGRDQDVTMFL